MIKKIISYGLFGILTTIVNILIFGVLNKLSVDYKISTILAWCISVIFAYIVNKKYVFKSTSRSKNEFTKEFSSFLAVRICSLIFDLLIMIVLVDLLNIDNLLSKIISNVIVVIINYFASEFIIFNNKK